jgi:hypothetical protein
MTAFFLKFLEPYAFMLLGMSYSLQQALEGLGINPTRFKPWTDASGSIIGSTLNVDASLALPILAVAVFCFVWFMVVTRALRALWGRRAM